MTMDDRIRSNRDSILYNKSLDIDNEDKVGIRSENTNVINKYYMFSYYVEHTCQTIPECMVFVMKDLGVVICVKLKNFDVNTLKET